MLNECKAQPAVSVHVRLDLASQDRRVRVQQKLRCTVPELFRKALVALEDSLTKERSKAV